MAPISKVLPLLLLALLLLMLNACCAASLAEGFRVDLTHVDSGRGFTRTELVRRALQRSKERAAWFAAKTSARARDRASTPLFPSIGEYLMFISIGNPPITYPAIADTGSDLIWTQCKPCVSCVPQNTPLFDPTTSSTFTYLPCTTNLCKYLFACLPFAQKCLYYYLYGDLTTTIGFLGNETFTLGTTVKTSFPNLGFGCGFVNKGVDPIGLNNASGLVGLGRGGPSLLSQTGIGKFSYCLTDPFTEEAKRSPLMFGSLAVRTIQKAAQKGKIQSIPLIRNPAQPSLYYIPLEGISVGSTPLLIPPSKFNIKKNGTGGTVIDSGTSQTHFTGTIFKKVVAELVAQFNSAGMPVASGSPGGYDLCFVSPKGASPASVKVPKIVLHFKGGVDVVLQQNNYLDVESAVGFLCVTFTSTGGEDGPIILGNNQQLNFQILYDLDDEKLTFAPTQCDKLRV